MKHDYDIRELQLVENLEHLINGAGLRFINQDYSIRIDSDITFKKCYFSKSFNIINKTPATLKLTDCFIHNLTIEVNSKFEFDLIDCSIDSLTIVSNRNRQELKVKIESTTLELSQVKKILIQDYCNLDINLTTIGSITYLNEGSGFIATTLNLKNCETLKDSEIALTNSSNHNLNVDNCKLGSISFTTCNNSFINLNNTKLSLGLTILKSQNLQITTVEGEIKQFRASDASDVVFRVKETSLDEISLNKSKGQLDIKASINVDLPERELNNQPKISILRVLDSTLSLNIKGYLVNLFFLRSNVSQQLVEDSSILSSLTIDQSYFSNSEFRNVSFRKGCNFILKHSDIVRVKFNTVDWMSNHKLDESRKTTTIIDSRAIITDQLSLKEAYRQLKVISKEASNKFDELSFRAHEQRMQKEILFLRREYLDWFLLWSNGVFSNYGLSYGRPLMFLFAFHFFFFSILMIATNTFDYTFYFLTNSSIDSATTMKAIGDYCSTLFPVHSFDYLKHQTGWPIIIDLTMRILSGYFIYYFLSASRKFHNT